MSDYNIEEFRPWREWTPPEPKVWNTKKYGAFDDNIYTFDIETISLFEDEDGEFRPFDYSKDADYYKMHKKVCCPYLWQFGSNGSYYYGRHLDDFQQVLKQLSDQEVTKYIYIHNAEYETQFLLDMIIDNGWTISECCARQKRQPIQYKINELNIVIRCSYQLTNLSLENAAIKFTDLEKAVGELDYNVPYSPLSKLPDNVMYYALMDVKVLTHVIDHFRKEYKHIKRIPLTQTGTVRRSIQQTCGFWYVKKQQKKVPPFVVYMALVDAYTGGISHGNILFLNQTLTYDEYGGFWSYDFSSSYPYVMCCYKLPQTPFRIINKKQYELYKERDSHAFLLEVKFKNVKSKYFNHYIPTYKMAEVEEYEKMTVDNGRLSKINGTFKMVLTDYDFDMIQECYTIEETEIIRIWASAKDYLEPEIIDFIITKYEHKTTLKGVAGQEVFYQKEKEELNAMYGISSQNILKSAIEFHPELEGQLDDNGEEMESWIISGLDENGDMTDEFAEKKLSDMKESFSTLFFPMACGCWITAIARTNLFRNIIKLDRQVVYYDTDSIKGFGEEVKTVVAEYNKEVEERIQESAKANNIDISKYKPYDIKGICHPIGYFDNETYNHKTGKEELYRTFKTLGAKKYMYEDHDGVNHLTMSGVRKKAVDWLNFDTFEDGTTLSYEACEKLLRLYEDKQEPFYYKDIDGNIFRCKQRHSIILQPTTFKIGVTDDLLALAAYYNGYMQDYV